MKGTLSGTWQIEALFAAAALFESRVSPARELWWVCLFHSEEDKSAKGLSHLLNIRQLIVELGTGLMNYDFFHLSIEGFQI